MFTRLKKIIALIGIGSTIIIFCIPSVRAQASDAATQLLGKIVQNTGSINGNTTGINQFLADIDQATTSAAPYATSNLWGNTNSILQALDMIMVELNYWLLQDTSQPTADLQNSLSSVVNGISQNQTTQLGLQQQLTSDFFGANVSPNNLPNANDLSYETLLGQPFFAKDPRNNPQTGTTVNAAYNYLKNASGLTITHSLPSAAWSGSSGDLQRYINYYNTISAVQTFNAYVLSQMYAESSNGTPFTKAQESLISTASGSGWFSTVASENIGFVLRQLLMFTSQSYVLLSQLLTTQNQLLQTQAMTNTLLILLNQSNEQTMAVKASGAGAKT